MRLRVFGASGARLLRAAWALGVAACGTNTVTVVDVPPPAPPADAAVVDAAPADAHPEEAGCPPALADRLTLVTIDLDAPIRYKRSGYDHFPLDERIAYSLEPNSSRARVAWLDARLQNVHVTPLTETGDKRDADAVVQGSDIGGLVALADGYALLTRRDDPGNPLMDPNNRGTGRAAILVRGRTGSKQSVESFAVPLTGTASIVNDDAPDHRDDCLTSLVPPELNGRLVFNGQKYGAYFAVHGCQGHFAASQYADKLVYVDDSGNYVPGGWDWGCSISEGMRLLREPEPSLFTAACLSTGAPHSGLNLQDDALLAPEWSIPGYVGGEFGSLVKTSSGYLVAWLSRGGVSDGGILSPPDIAFAILSSSRTLVRVTVPEETPDVAEANLHVAPYGPNAFAVIWDSIENLNCQTPAQSLAQTCFGSYTGTYVRIVDASGHTLMGSEKILAPPNGNDDIAVFPNGDLGWAFVGAARDYSAALADIDSLPQQQTITIARLRYCPVSSE